MYYKSKNFIILDSWQNHHFVVVVVVVVVVVMWFMALVR